MDGEIYRTKHAIIRHHSPGRVVVAVGMDPDEETPAVIPARDLRDAADAALDLPKHTRGLFDKYDVYEDGDEVEDVFVLEPVTDPAARQAIRAYADATENQVLASHLWEWMEGLEVHSDD